LRLARINCFIHAPNVGRLTRGNNTNFDYLVEINLNPRQWKRTP
jgi:hypothetical protein